MNYKPISLLSLLPMVYERILVKKERPASLMNTISSITGILASGHIYLCRTSILRCR